MLCFYCMHSNRRNTKLLLLILIVFISIIALLSAYILFQNTNTSSRETKQKNFSEFIITTLDSKKDSEIDMVFVKQKLSELENNKNPDDKKYQSLSDLAMYLSDRYIIANDPTIRLLITNTISEYAKDNFKKYYTKQSFNVMCSDSQCGMELSPEIQEALALIKKSGIPDYAKNTLSLNLRYAGHLENGNIDNKITGIKLSMFQAEVRGDPTASAAAEILKKYLHDKYKANYSIKEFIE